MPFRGTHGTSRSRADAIIASQKFEPSAKGYAGHGVYLWACDEHWGLAVQLAELWWASATNKGTYLKDTNKQCCVLKAKIDAAADDGIYLDITSNRYREKIFELANTKSVSDGQYPGLIDWFLSQLFKESNSEPTVVRISIFAPPPVKNTGYSLAQRISRMADAYVVREGGIHLIKDIEMHA